jgi:spore maturation protein CgeB
MPRVLVVHPGPDFSVADVFRGYCRGFEELGWDVMQYNLGDRMTWASVAHLAAADGSFVKAFPEPEDVYSFALSGLYRAAYRWWPDVVVFISGFVMDQDTIEVFKSRGHKVACVFTESPYEDSRQMVVAPAFDAVTVNDEASLHKYDELTTAIYTPHAYDPTIHHPGFSTYKSDCVFVGTGYPSRQAFMKRVDWTGIDFVLAGGWKHADEALTSYLVHDIEDCLDNEDTAEMYRGSATSFNLYRSENNGDVADSGDGWACGPREIELAACGTWFARQSRAESDRLFPMLPTFSSPEELGDQIRWALANPDKRDAAACAARAAIADRTFPNNVAALLGALGV